MKVVRLSALRTGRPYPPGSITGTRFCCRKSQPQGHSATGKIMSMKTSIDTIGDRTCDLPACSGVPQRNVPPRAPVSLPIRIINFYIFVFYGLTLPLISVTVLSVESCSNCVSHTPFSGEFRKLYCEMYVKMSMFAL